MPSLPRLRHGSVPRLQLPSSPSPSSPLLALLLLAIVVRAPRRSRLGRPIRPPHRHPSALALGARSLFRLYHKGPYYSTNCLPNSWQLPACCPLQAFLRSPVVRPGSHSAGQAAGDAAHQAQAQELLGRPGPCSKSCAYPPE